jgi:hypothetical protein
MDFQITIPDNSPELEELNYVIAQINKENPVTPITALQYLQNIVMGYFTQRVKSLYQGFASKQDITKLKDVFGTLDKVRKDN